MLRTTMIRTVHAMVSIRRRSSGSSTLSSVCCCDFRALIPWTVRHDPSCNEIL